MNFWLRNCRRLVALPLAAFLSYPTLGNAAENDETEAETPQLESARFDALPGMPDVFHLTYKADDKSISPNRQYAMIYPGSERVGGGERKNYLVCLHPLRLLALTAVQYYPNERHGGEVFCHWSKDSHTVIIGTIGRLQGATSVELYEVSDGKITRFTDLLAETVRLAEPDFHRAGATPQGEGFNFSETSGEGFDEKPSLYHWAIDDRGQVRIQCSFSNASETEITPEDWNVEVQATWNIKEHRFTQHKIKRVKR